MTDYEFQLQNEISDLRSTINGLRAELKQRDDAYNELSAMFESCQEKLREAFENQDIVYQEITKQRTEIELVLKRHTFYCEHLLKKGVKKEKQR